MNIHFLDVNEKPKLLFSGQAQKYLKTFFSEILFWLNYKDIF